MEIGKVIVYLIYDILKEMETVKLHFIFSEIVCMVGFVQFIYWKTHSQPLRTVLLCRLVLSWIFLRGPDFCHEQKRRWCNTYQNIQLSMKVNFQIYYFSNILWCFVSQFVTEIWALCVVQPLIVSRNGWGQIVEEQRYASLYGLLLCFPFAQMFFVNIKLHFIITFNHIQIYEIRV